MKNFVVKIGLAVFIPLCFLLPLVSFSQDVLLTEKGSKYTITRLNENTIDEVKLRKDLQSDGLSDVVINAIIAQRKKLIHRHEAPLYLNGKNKNPLPMAVCSDMGGESGWGGWQGAVGTNNAPPTFPAPGVPAAPNFVLTSGAGVDPCTPGPQPGAPPLPVVAPGFGNASIMMGVPQQSGYGAEQLIYSLTVNASDTNFLYAYAYIIQDAGTTHSAANQPFVEFIMLAPNGDTVDCSYKHYIGGPNLPGVFQTKSNCNTPLPPWNANNQQAYYNPWSTVGVNLAQYVGQTITCIITNADCSQGGHFAYSYWDFQCPPILSSSPSFCQGQVITLTGPASDPSNPYTYTWYVNGVVYTGLPSASAQVITPIPQVGDTFAVFVQQSSGCNFWIPYIPVPISITANFTLVNNCGTVAFTDASVSPGGNPITSWNWAFPGGTPATSAVQNPVVTFPPGTYTVTLIAISQSGCKDTFQLPLTTGMPTAAFSTGPVCLGTPTLFSDSSVAPTGDTLNGWAWDFGDGNISNQQNPSHLYTVAGTYSVTLTIATQAGCTNTITLTVTVDPIPVPAFTSSIVCFNTASTVFNNQSAGATIWNWDFGDGNTSTQQNPSHTYGTPGTFTVTLIAENISGCKDTLPLVAIVNPLPVATFTTGPVCLGSPTNFTDGSSITPGTVTGWSWNFGDPASGAANTSALQNPSHTFSGPGTFTVILTATSDSGCQSITMLPASVYPLPAAAITPQNVCLNSLTNFLDASTSATGNAINTWDWNFGDGSPNAAQQNPSHTYVTPGTYTITLIVTTANGCKDTTTNTVIIYQPPVANYTDSVKGCAPACATFQDISTSVDGTIAVWQWSFPGGTPAVSSAKNPTICWNTPGMYDVQLIATSSFGCVDTLSTPLYINIYSWPVADFCVAPSLASINDPQFLFCDQWTPDVTKWIWNFGDGSPFDSASTDPWHTYSASVSNNDFYNFTIVLAVQNQYGCWDTISHTIDILPEFTFYIPNTFTPNEDGLNELFFGKGRGIKEYEIWLFDRWGNMIWTCDHSGKNTDWDGPGQDGMPSFCKWNGPVTGGGLDMSGNSGEFAQEDVYVWKVNLTDIFDKRHTYVGHVNIVR